MTGLSRRRLLLGGASAACALPLAFGGRAVAAGDTVDDAGQRSSLAALLPALTSWRRSHKQRSTLDTWRYQIAWKPASLPPTRTTRAALKGRRGRGWPCICRWT